MADQLESRILKYRRYVIEPDGLIQLLFSVVHSTIKKVRKGVLFESFESISGKVVKHAVFFKYLRYDPLMM